jgi:hypothetical protein
MEIDDIFTRRLFLISSMKKALKREYCKTIYNKILLKIISIIEEDKDDHLLSLSLDDCDKVSFADSTKHKFDNSKRLKTTFPKYVRTKLNIQYKDIPDYTLDNFTKIVFNYLKCNNKAVSELKGDDLKDYFRSMKKSIRNLTAKEIIFYSKNPHKVSWIVAFNLARTLKWVCDDGTQVIDIIYPENELYEKTIIEWSEKNNFKYVKNLSKEELYKLRITLKCKYIENIPYQDTFKYGEIDRNIDDIIVLSADPKFGNLCIGDNYKPYMKELHCSDCNISSKKQLLTKIENKLYCKECIYKKYKFCKVCKNYKPISEKGIEEVGYKKNPTFAIFDVDPAWMCNDCCGNTFNYEKCNQCNNIVPKISTKYQYSGYSNKRFCSECLKKYTNRCDQCNMLEITTNKNGKNLCSSCESKHAKCIKCNAFFFWTAMNNVIFKGVKMRDAICQECCKDLNRCNDCYHFIYKTEEFPIKNTKMHYSLNKTVCELCYKKNNNYFGIGNRENNYLNKDKFFVN